MASYSGTVTTTGKSEAIRLDKALFRMHPEFCQKAKVRAQVIAPGQALISVISENPTDALDDDPIVLAFLNMLGEDMRRNPGRRSGLSKRDIARALRLTKNVRVADSDRLPKS